MLKVFVFGVSILSAGAAILSAGAAILSAGAAMAQAAGDPPPPIEQVPADVAQWFTSTMDKVLEPVTGKPEEPAPPPAPAKHRRKDH